MKNYLVLLLMFFFIINKVNAQLIINDRAVRYQQERMVYKHWSNWYPEKPTWKPNTWGRWPLYLLTWAWHPNYYKGIDRRPLSSNGPYTQRNALLASMYLSNTQILEHSKELKKDALWEMVNYSSLTVGADPMWQIYYKREFKPLMEMNITADIPPKELVYLNNTGVLKWYLDECDIIRDRLNGLQQEDMDRGDRMLAYHRMLGEFNKLQEKWRYHAARAGIMLQMLDAKTKVNKVENVASWKKSRTDVQIADDIFSKATLNLK